MRIDNISPSDHDPDTAIGMGFSILITVCSLIGLLFCFRRASSLLPRNLNIQLQMFGNNSNSNNNGTGRRGPIALTDDDLVGATGIEWEDIEAQLREGQDEEAPSDHDENYNDDDDNEEELQDMAARPLKPMNSGDRYLDFNDDEDDQNQGEEMTSGINQRYRDSDDDDDGDIEPDAVGGARSQLNLTGKSGK